MFSIRVLVIRRATPPAQPEDKNPTEGSEDKKEAARPMWKWARRLGNVIGPVVAATNLIHQLPISF